MVKFHTGGGLAVSLPTPARPLLNPPSSGVHGSSKVDCVTLWSLFMYIDVMKHRSDRPEIGRMPGKISCSPSNEHKTDNIASSSNHRQRSEEKPLVSDFHLAARSAHARVRILL